MDVAGLGNLSAVFFFPIFMYIFQLGITGAAISTVLSQYVPGKFYFVFPLQHLANKLMTLNCRYIVAILMLWHLNKKTVLLLPSIKNLQFGGYLKSGK